MNKVLCASISALLMTGSLSAFAAATTYTDLDSGFELKSQPAWMEIGGRSFYGLNSQQMNFSKNIKIYRFWSATGFRLIK